LGVEFWRKGYRFQNPFRDFDGPWKTDRFPADDMDEIGRGFLVRAGQFADAPLTVPEPVPLHPTTLPARARNRAPAAITSTSLQHEIRCTRKTAWNAPAAVVDPNVLAILVQQP
jgi:hypothetical protein